MIVPPTGLIVTAMSSRQLGATMTIPLFATVGAAGVAVLRLVFSALFLLVASRPSLRMDRPTAVIVILCGTFFAGMNLCFYQALDRIPLGITVAIEFTGPLLVAVLGTKRWLDLLWAVLAGIGVVLLGWTGGASSLPGMAFAAAAAGCWAGYILLAGRLSRASSDNSGLALAMAVGGLLSLPVGVITVGDALVSPTAVGMGILLAVMSSVIPYSLEFVVLRRIPAKTFSVQMSLEPAIGAIAGYLMLSQHLDWLECVALGCVIVASIGTTRQPTRVRGHDRPYRIEGDEPVPSVPPAK